jgi:hypothetical protein
MAFKKYNNILDKIMTHMECKECEIRYYQDRLNQL